MSVPRSSLLVVALCVALTALLAAADLARAAGVTTSVNINGDDGDLVPGAATVPAFHMDFLLNDVGRLDAAPAGTTQNLEISLTAPNNSVMRFLFSPRTQFGVGYDPIAGANRAYAALTWNLFKDDAIYGNLGVAGSFDPALGGGGTDPMHRTVLAPLMFHSAVEFGYSFSSQNSLSLAVDQGVIPVNHGAGPEPVDNFVLRYGLKF
jgi:hypothetical protein